MDTHSLIHNYVSTARDLAKAMGETWTPADTLKAVQAAHAHLDAGRRRRGAILAARIAEATAQGVDLGEMPAGDVDPEPDHHAAEPQVSRPWVPGCRG